MAARASRYDRTGQTAVMVLVSLMGSWCARLAVVVLERWKLFGEQRRRRAARQFGEVVGEMGLVVVAAGGRHLRDRDVRRCRDQHATGPFEAHDPAGQAGSQPELVTEPAG